MAMAATMAVPAAMTASADWTAADQARFAELSAKDTLTTEEQDELDALTANEDRTATVTAGTTKVKIANLEDYPDKGTHAYNAYAIFTGSSTANGLQVSAYGRGFDNEGLLADATFLAIPTTAGSTIQADLVAVLKDAGKLTDESTADETTAAIKAATAAQLAQVLEKVASANADKLAASLKNHIGTATATQVTGEGTELAAGYYIIVDNYTVVAGENDAESKFILKVTGADKVITINPKKSYPQAIKKVKENLASNVEGTTTTFNGTESYDVGTQYNDVADYDIGDTVPFRLYGTVPDMSKYDHYYYKFTDTLDAQFDAPEEVTVTLKTGETLTWTAKPGDDVKANYNASGDLVVANGANDTKGYTISVSTDANTKVTTITVLINDLKAWGLTAGTDVVKVDYEARLNKNAIVGNTGQLNAVKLEYSNNPNVEYDGSGTPDDDTTEETPEDKVIVFTYEIDAKKIDGDTKKALADAEFTLQNTDSKYAVVEVSSNIFLGWSTSTVNADRSAEEANYDFDGDGTNETIATTTLVSPANGIFYVRGLDDGTYTLTETAAPEGYNITNATYTLELVADTQNGQEWDNFVNTEALADNAITLKVGSADAVTIPNDNRSTKTEDFTIENNKGTTLPETGGMGTVLFYTVGGVLVVGAGVVLISKKRSKDVQ